jgi:hypothetical protein
MKKIVKLTERDLSRLVKRVINEGQKTMMENGVKMVYVMGLFDNEILEVIEKYKMKLSEVFSEIEDNKMLDEEDLERLTDDYEGYMSEFENVKNLTYKGKRFK